MVSAMLRAFPYASKQLSAMQTNFDTLTVEDAELQCEITWIFEVCHRRDQLSLNQFQTHRVALTNSGRLSRPLQVWV